MGVRLGLNAKIYRNTGTYAVPVWDEIKKVKDVTLTLEKNLADVSTRAGSGWREYAATLKDATIEFALVVDDVAEHVSDFTALKDAFINNTSIEVAVSDTTITTSGAQYFRSTVDVAQFTRNEPLEDAVMYDVQLKPTPAANAPSWTTVP